MEAEEGLEKIQDALKICDLYVSSYLNHKDKMSNYFKEKPVLNWNFESNMIFGNLNKFVNRLKVIQVLYLYNTSYLSHMFVLCL